MHAPSLSLPNNRDPFILDTDASDIAVAACLYQLRDSIEQPVAFASQTLAPAQRRYCTTKKELLAIVAFTRQFRHYLLGQQFTVRTDHGSLAWLFRFKNPVGQLGRWLEELGQYDMIIQHRPGIKHVNADALSRIPDRSSSCNCYEAGKNLESLPCGGCSYCAKLHMQWDRFHEDVDDVVPLAIRNLGTTDDNRPGRSYIDVGLQLQGYSNAELRELQLQDSSVGTIIAWLESEAPDERELLAQGYEVKKLWRCNEMLALVEGVLYYKWIDEWGQSQNKLVVPLELRQSILSMAHDGVLGGHWGEDKTLSRLKAKFFWPSMSQDVKLFTATCHRCNTNKHQLKNRTGLITYQAGVPNERVHLDFLGPFTLSAKGNRYILSMVDQFTKWIEVYALPEQTALVTAKAFVDGWICRFGVPLQVHTDQGRNFTSALFTELCRMLDASKTRTTPYRPSSNGQVERYNQMILSYVRCQLSGNDDNWDEFLPLFGLSLRSTVNRNTGFTPNMLQLGREVILPLDIFLGTPQCADSTPPEYVQNLNRRMREIFQTTRNKLDAAQKRQKTDYDTRASLRTTLYEVGDLVYLVNNTSIVGHSSKLQPLMKGPFVVEKVNSPCIYTVRGRSRAMVVHHDKMKLCEDRCIPLWVSRLRKAILDGTAPPSMHDDNDNIGLVSLPLPDSREVLEASGSDSEDEEFEVSALPTQYQTRSGRTVKVPTRFQE